MQIFNNQGSNNGSSKRNCSYCCSPDHVVTECPNAVSDWAFFQRHEIPLKGGSNKHWTIGARQGYRGATYDHWFREPREWGKWFVECERAIAKIEKAKLREANKKSAKRRTSKCGFCGRTDHNRRDCLSMQQFKSRLLEANRGWRERIYDRLVGDLGLSVGAIVKVESYQGWNQPTLEKVGIIESINWDELSMFCIQDTGGSRWSDRVRQDFQQRLKVQVNVEGNSHILTFHKSNSGYNSNGKLSDSFGTLVDTFGYNHLKYITTIARSETPLDEEWVNQGHENAMDFLVKKYSMAKLKEWNVEKLLLKVENENNLKKLQQSA